MAEKSSTDSDDDGGKRLGLVGLAVGALTVLAFVAMFVVMVAGSDFDAKAGGVTLSAQETAGRKVFTANCSNCHVLAAANSPGMIGPNLDELKPPKALVLDAIEKGRARGNNLMPAQLVTGEDAEDVAAFIEAVAGKKVE